MSPRTAARLGRILAMLPWVIANPGSPVDEVCGRFGYTRSQLIDDLNLVMVCGLPGYGPGDLMWAEVEDDSVVVDAADYFAATPRLSPGEALTLLAAGLALLSSGQAPPALSSAVEKLSKVVLPGGADSVSIDLAGEPELVSLLRGAAGRHHVVAITYTALASDETTERLVEPWAVFSSLGNWYLSGFCRRAEAQRIFRVDRVRAAAETDQLFDPPSNVAPPTVGYTPSEDDVRAVIKLAEPARWVADYYPLEVVEDTENALVVRFSASDPSVIGRLLVRLGPHAELIEGEDVARSTAELRRSILARYRDA